MQLQEGWIVQTRKKHPCGSDRWEIVRTGADVKFKCLGCGHVVMLSAEAARKAVKGVENAGR